MAKKLTEKQLYRAKVEWFQEQGYDEIEPMAFYRELFPVGTFEKPGEYDLKTNTGTGKPNAIMVRLNVTEGRKQRLIFDDLETIQRELGNEDVILSPIGYMGRTRKTKNARWLYAMVFDLDGQGLPQLRDTLFQMNSGHLARATYVILSGHGCHVYYVFKEPIEIKNDHIYRELNKLKTGLTMRIWNDYTSTMKEPQIQPIGQGFRMVGSASKMGKRYPVRAYRVGDRVTIDDLNAMFPDGIDTLTAGALKRWTDYRINLDYAVTTPIEDAKELWPDWYERRVIRGQRKGRWYVKRALYDWWLKRLRGNEVKVGHRYFAVLTLGMYAYKCNIPFDELKQDAYSLLEPYESMTDDENNHFTEKDIHAALKVYHEGATNYPRDLISKLSGLLITENKRNYRKQEDHLARIRALQEFDYPNGSWRNKNGRPKGSGTKREVIHQWRKQNPDGRKIDCERDTGFSRHTVLKWWDYQPDNYKAQVLATIKSEIGGLANEAYQEFLHVGYQTIEKYSGNISSDGAKKITATYLQELFLMQERMMAALIGGGSRGMAYQIFWDSYVKNEL